MLVGNGDDLTSMADVDAWVADGESDSPFSRDGVFILFFGTQRCQLSFTNFLCFPLVAR